MADNRVFAALVRHGDYQQLANTPSAHQPFQLTAKGFSQAAELAPLLKQQCKKLNCQINPIIASSRLLRAWQTAIETVAGLGNASIKVAQYSALAERSVGSVANLSTQQITELVKLDPRFKELPDHWKSNSHFCLPFQGAESLMQAGNRVASFLTAQMQTLQQTKQGNQLKVFVAHGAAIRHAAYHLGLLEFEQISQLSMYHCKPIFVEYTREGKWLHIAGDWKIRNEHSKFTD